MENGEELRPGAGHRLVLEERERLTISGVEEVERFDEESILLTTVLGGLEIQGENLHIEQLSLHGGELKVSGTVSTLSYEVETPRKGGWFSRLMGG